MGKWLQEVVGGTRRVEDLEARARTLEQTVAREEDALKAIQEKLEQRRALLQRAEVLEKAGVTPEAVAQWMEVLARAGVEPGELASAIRECGSLMAASHKLEDHKAKLEVSIKVLEERQGELREAIKQSKENALAAIDLAGKELSEKIRLYGEGCRLSEVLRRDLALSGALYAMSLPELAGQVTPGTVMLLLHRVRQWLEATRLNAKAKCPAGVAKGEWQLQGYELPIEDLLLWLIAGLLPLSEKEISAAS